MRSKAVATQEIWLMQRVKELLPDCTLKPLIYEAFDSTLNELAPWVWIGVYLNDGTEYCGGFGFEECWIRVIAPKECPRWYQQRVRNAVNHAIAELAEQRQAA